MSNNFLRSYTIPTITANSPASASLKDGLEQCDQTNGNMSPPPGASTQSSLFDQLNYNCADNTQQSNNQVYQNPSRFVPPGKLLTEYSLQKRVPKRKIVSRETLSLNPSLCLGRDESYPDELNELLKPLFCELCNAQLNSPKTANIHYQSKVHDKNLNSWLARNFTDKGLVAPTIKRFYIGSTGPVGPDAYHCEYCDLKLTSKLHAQQHFAGRKHKLVLSKVSKPSGSGYYDTEGKWVRTGTKATPPASNDGRFGIGEQFKNESPTKGDVDMETEPEDQPLAKVQKLGSPKSEPLLTCKLCNVSVASPMQLNIHLDGIKHRKKVNASGEQVADVAMLNPADTVMASLNDAAEFEDLSMYRTPSGSYYCKTCNISMAHQSALLQHLQGKKHIKKASADAPVQAAAE